jgi:hypothetical protein
LVVHARGLQNGGVFTREARDVLREHLLSMASSDDRIVGGAVLGSRARGGGDEWSDLDIMFAVREDLSVIDVLDDWTTRIGRDLGATKLFDLPSGAAVYRVFLLRNSLELDLSMIPAPEFRPTGPSFSLLFGEAAAASVKPDMSIQELFGYAVHHAFHARACIDRDGPGMPSTGSARCGITSSTWLVVAGGSTGTTAETSTSCLPTSSFRATVHWSGRSSPKSFAGRFPRRESPSP